MADLSMLDVIKAGASKQSYHPVRDMPRCQWYGQHRYELDEILPNGSRIERCMDCQANTRVWP